MFDFPEHLKSHSDHYTNTNKTEKRYRENLIHGIKQVYWTSKSWLGKQKKNLQVGLPQINILDHLFLMVAAKNIIFNKCLYHYSTSLIKANNEPTWNKENGTARLGLFYNKICYQDWQNLKFSNQNFPILKTNC